MVVAGAIFWSCQKDELLNPDDAMLKKGKVAATVVENPLTWTEVCAGEDLVLTLIGSGNRQIQHLVNDNWINEGNISNGDEPLIITIENISAGIHYFRYKIGSGGFTDLEPIVIPSCDCQDLLKENLICGENGSPNKLTVTFTAGEAGEYVIQGGLNAKVDGTVVSMESNNNGSFNTEHSGVVNSNANVIRWEGTIEACKDVEIIVEFSGKCEIGDWTAKIK